jgi:hypothetical protein
MRTKTYQYKNNLKFHIREHEFSEPPRDLCVEGTHDLYRDFVLDVSASRIFAGFHYASFFEIAEGDPFDEENMEELDIYFLGSEDLEINLVGRPVEQMRPSLTTLNYVRETEAILNHLVAAGLLDVCATVPLSSYIVTEELSREECSHFVL